MSSLRKLHEAGQAVWLDFLRRGLIAGGNLERLIREDAVSGVTSNPTIFGKAIAGSTDYDGAIAVIAGSGAEPLDVIYELALEDVQMAADLFRPVHDGTGGLHGFVSFELEPRFARDTQGSIASALDLFARIDRPNVMIKVPGTEQGVPVVEELTFAGVNVNITLLFSVDMYEAVARAFIAGLERRLEARLPVDRVAGVASFFVSRVDTAVDALLPAGSHLRGRIAVANAKRAYQRFLALFSGRRWERLASAGARVQRPLWASTGTKNAEYSDVLYVETLVGPNTVNTMPEATIDAFRDHGRVDPDAITTGVEDAEEALAQLGDLGVDLDRITRAELVDAGIKAFDDDLRKLLSVIADKLEAVRAGTPRWSASLGSLEKPVRERLRAMAEAHLVERIWRKDHTVWKDDPTEIADRLGWLGVAETMREHVADLETFARACAADGFTRAVLLGMGGSSLAPEVLRATYGAGLLDLLVLDTTHPETIARVERSLDAKTLFVVASKSGTTVETLSHFAYFFDRVGSDGSRFVAITDPGMPLEALAGERGFRATFRNPADVGGRYSALSLFGLVPAALIGADLLGLLDAAEEMASACNGCVAPAEDPGAWLGAVLAEAALAGRDKLTLVLDPELASFGAWVEQLVAESTGKEGRGIVPVDGEPVGSPDVYGDDRLFVALGDAGDGLDAVEAAGHPVVRLSASAKELGAELFRWELATAVAGAVLGINPFDQPNVAEAKEATRRILSEGAVETGFDDPAPLLASIRSGDYVAIQAYVDPTSPRRAALERVRVTIRDRYRVATTLGFGPRYLHSTGQLHKGGPSSGVFMQVVDETRETDRPIPGAPYTFGALIDAQAAGDLRSLRDRGRRVARVTLAQLEAAL